MKHAWEDSFQNTSAAGGYFNSTTGTGVETPSNPANQVRRTQSVVPVVVRQIRNCPKEEFTLFGMPAQILTIVGILREYEVQSTKATYTIEDHTGSIKAIWWLENDSDTTPNLPPVKENNYVQIYGSLRVQDGEKILMVLKMFPVDDCNILTNHLLQVIHARLEAEALANAPKENKALLANNPGAELANVMHYNENDATGVGDMSSSLTPLQKKVFQIVQQAGETTAGVYRNVVFRQFPQHQQRQVNDALEFLINEGHAYSTIDNDHFKTTNTL